MADVRLVALFVALLVGGLAASARADVVRLHWRGTVADGAGPPRLERAVEAHVAVALKGLGTELATSPPWDAEGGARCVFAERRLVATCEVEVVQREGGLRAERKAEVPFRDAEDLAESLALLVGDMVGTELHEVARPAEPEPPPDLGAPPPPATAPPSPPPGPGERVTRRPARPLPRPRPPRRLLPQTLDVAVLASCAIGFQGDPVLGGLQLQASYGYGLLRVGGTLLLDGTQLHSGGYDLTFLRFVTGPRVGVGGRRGRLAGEISLGPALEVLATDAHVASGQHTLTTFLVVGGLRGMVRIAGGLAVVAGVDAGVATSREQIRAGETKLAEFGLGLLEVSLGLAYHR